MVRQLQNLVGRRDLTPPQRAGVSPPYRIRDYSRAKRARFKAIAALTR